MIKKLFSGALANIFNLLLQLLLGLWVFRELYNYLGEYDFGVWALLFAVFSHVVLFEFGLGMVITRHSAKDSQYFDFVDKELIDSCFKTFYICSIAVIIFFVIVSFFSSMFFPENNEFKQGDSILIVSFLLACSFISNYLSGAYQAYLLGKMEHTFVNKVRLIANLSRSLLLIIFIEINLPVVSLAAVYTVVSFVELIVRAKKCFNLNLTFNPVKAKYNFSQIYNDVNERGKKLFLLRVNDYAKNSAPIIVASSLIGVAAVAPLRISGRLMELFSEVMMSFNFVLTPYFSKISAVDDTDISQKVFFSVALSSAFSSLILANLFLHGEWFLELWLGQSNSITYQVLVLFACAFCLSNMQAPLNSFLIAKEHYKQLSILAIIEFLLTLLGLVIGIYFWGVLGAGYALFFSMFIVRILIQPKVAVSDLGLKVKLYYMVLFIPPMLVFIFMYLTYKLSQLNLFEIVGGNIAQILIQVFGLILISIITYQFFVRKQVIPVSDGESK